MKPKTRVRYRWDSMLTTALAFMLGVGCGASLIAHIIAGG